MSVDSGDGLLKCNLTGGSDLAEYRGVLGVAFLVFGHGHQMLPSLTTFPQSGFR